MHIAIITKIPTTPTAFLIILLHPIIVFTASPKILPTTGTTEDIAVFAALAVTPSTLAVKPPSNDVTLTNKVNTVPKIHTILEFKNLESFPTCAWSDIFEIIPKAVATSATGINIFVIKLLINVTIKSNIGCNIPEETIFPVVIIRVIKRGIKVFANPVRFCTAVFISVIILEKLVIIRVIINIYSM